MRQWWSKVRAVFESRCTISDDLDEELESHLELEIEDHIALGMPPDKARHKAQSTFGSKMRIKEDARSAWAFPMLESFLNDIVYGGRTMRKTPVFAIAAVLTLGLGIGGNTAVFSVIRGVLLKPLNYLKPDQLVRLTIDNPSRNLSTFTPVRYDEIRAVNKSFQELGAFGMREDVTLLAGGEPEQVKGIRISANFTHILGVQPILGRGFLPDEEKPDGPAVAIISAELWHRRFHANPSVIGQIVSLDARPYTIVGVLSKGFGFPFADLDVWLPRLSEWSMVSPGDRSGTATLTGFARLRARVKLKQARVEMEVLNRQYARSHPGLPDANSDSAMRVQRLRDELVANVQEMLWVLFGAVGLVLLIACANIASLLLARAASRSREFALRTALGATRSRLIRQLLAECILLSAAGGALGIFLAKWALSALTDANSVNLPRSGEIRLDTTVLTFTVTLSLLTGVLFGLFPSFQASRPDLAKALRDRGEGASQILPRKRRFGISARNLLVVGQIALSIVLLIGAALLLKSFVHLRAVDPGFQSGGLLTAQIELPPVRYDTNAKRAAFWEELVQQVEEIHGVQSATVTLTLPMSPAYAISFQPAEQTLKKLSERPIAQFQSVTPGYLKTLRIPVRAGRTFTDRDDMPGGPRVALINDSIARRFWPGYPRGKSPVGQHLILGSGKSSAEIVGVVADVHEYGLSSEAGLEVYVPCSLSPPQSGALVARTLSDPRGFVDAIRRRVLSIDHAEPISHVQTMNERVDGSILRQRTLLMLLGLFAGMAMLLAVIGIYGVIAYSVVQRTQELGIRRALGAQNSDILRLVVGEGLRLTGIGILIGTIGAFGVTRVMSNLLYHVKSSDPGTFATIALVFFMVSIAASYIPALRATRIDPMKALR